MGITGTEVAKDAADMILLDDNFASIVNGVEEGRIIFDNLKKSIAYTLSSNIPEIAPFLLYQTVGIPLPLTTVMILMVDLGTDLAPAISLAHEGKEADIMERPPRDPQRDKLVTWRLISFSYLQIGILQAIAGFYAYFVVLFEYGLKPGYLPGLDEHNVFGYTKDSDVLENSYFMWCFDNTDYKCVYTPKEFSCDWVKWDDPYSPFKGSGDWAPKSNTDPYKQNVIWPSSKGDCNTKKKETPEVFEEWQALFSSMICQWSKEVDPSTDRKEDPCALKVGSSFVKYTSKGTEAGVYLDESDRYEQRFCDEEDLDGDNWTKQIDSTSDGYKDVKYDVVHTLARMDSRILCDNDGMQLTNKGGPTKNSIFPFQHQDRVNALAKSNTAYFISIIVVQWADLMICKTRSRSLFEQGMTNVFMNWSILFETVLGAFLCYIPFANIVTQTQPINFVWWTPAIPFSLTIYAYDELRKGAIRVSRRKGQLGWLEYNTYW